MLIVDQSIALPHHFTLLPFIPASVSVCVCVCVFLSLSLPPPFSLPLSLSTSASASSRLTRPLHPAPAFAVLVGRQRGRRGENGRASGVPAPLGPFGCCGCCAFGRRALNAALQHHQRRCCAVRSAVQGSAGQGRAVQCRGGQGSAAIRAQLPSCSHSSPRHHVASRFLCVCVLFVCFVRACALTWPGCLYFVVSALLVSQPCLASLAVSAWLHLPQHSVRRKPVPVESHFLLALASQPPPAPACVSVLKMMPQLPLPSSHGRHGARVVLPIASWACLTPHSFFPQ